MIMGKYYLRIYLQGRWRDFGSRHSFGVVGSSRVFLLTSFVVGSFDCRPTRSYISKSWRCIFSSSIVSSYAKQTTLFARLWMYAAGAAMSFHKFLQLSI